jgi:hypothetical protein
MIKQTLTAAALAAVLAAPAYAQQPMNKGSGTAAQPSTTQSQSTMPSKDSMKDTSSPAKSSMPGQSAAGTQKAGFVQHQDATEWRGSKLIGASVYGPDNSSIGEINDVIIGSDGTIKAAVVGVGGFLGVGEKDVALPFESLNVTRKQNSSSIDKISVSFSKDELKNAPKLAYYQAEGSATTGAGSNANGAMTKTPATTPNNTMKK